MLASIKLNFTKPPQAPVPPPTASREYFQVMDTNEGNGYRLYYGDDKYVSQVDGTSATTYRTVGLAIAACEKRYGETPVRITDRQRYRGR